MNFIEVRQVTAKVPSQHRRRPRRRLRRRRRLELGAQRRALLGELGVAPHDVLPLALELLLAQLPPHVLGRTSRVNFGLLQPDDLAREVKLQPTVAPPARNS